MFKNNSKADSETKKNADLLRYLTILLIIYPIFLTILIITNITKWTDLGNFGSLLSGTLGPFVTAITGVLLYSSIKEQIKSNEISVNNNSLGIILSEINIIEFYRKDDISILKKILYNIATREDKVIHEQQEDEYFDETINEWVQKGEFVKLDFKDWLELIAIARKIEICFEESLKIEHYNSIPILKVRRIYVTGLYQNYFYLIKSKLMEVDSVADKVNEKNLFSLFKNIEKLLQMPINYQFAT